MFVMFGIVKLLPTPEIKLQSLNLYVGMLTIPHSTQFFKTSPSLPLYFSVDF